VERKYLNVGRLARIPLMRTVERWNSELDDELLHPAQRMTNPCACGDRTILLTAKSLKIS
jgi:hypothetical protein